MKSRVSGRGTNSVWTNCKTWGYRKMEKGTTQNIVVTRSLGRKRGFLGQAKNHDARMQKNDKKKRLFRNESSYQGRALEKKEKHGATTIVGRSGLKLRRGTRNLGKSKKLRT